MDEIEEIQRGYNEPSHLDNWNLDMISIMYICTRTDFSDVLFQTRRKCQKCQKSPIQSAGFVAENHLEQTSEWAKSNPAAVLYIIICFQSEHKRQGTPYI